jgi:hypothetical protein
VPRYHTEPAVRRSAEDHAAQARVLLGRGRPDQAQVHATLAIYELLRMREAFDLGKMIGDGVPEEWTSDRPSDPTDPGGPCG